LTAVLPEKQLSTEIFKDNSFYKVVFAK